MNDLIKEIQTDINGEKLLFLNKEIYTVEEKKMIIKSVSNRINKTYNYCELIRGYLPRIEKILDEFRCDPELINDMFQVAVQINIHKSKNEYLMLDDASFITFTMRNNMGYGANESYSSVVLNRLFEVEDVRNILDEKKEIQSSKGYTDFIITNNYMLRKYPKFYSEEDLKKLKEIAKTPSKKDFASKKEYQEFKFARNSLLHKLTTKDKVLSKRR